MRFSTKEFGALTNTELYSLLKLRAEVFVVEQKCPYSDPDGKDDKALHVMGFEGSELAAYARCFAPGIYFKEMAIGRVVVDPAHRGKELGKAIMHESMRVCRERFGKGDIVISAQLYLERFYTDLGFKREGEVYPEDDIPHIKMRAVYQ